ncbi:MAG: RsmD family RNA methyltransferase [Acetobacteraceae bacterium]|nr:RsmD family RNA methyltransferase [Acetobacteraceae bacterium]
MRIIAGRHRGRKLVAPEGEATRPTSDRARQALFDMLWHAPWAGREVLEGAVVLDAFAGTGALGLEALSRGAARAHFIEAAPAALAALRANIRACREEERAKPHAADALRPLRAPETCSVILLDPPYGKGLLAPALAALALAGWYGPGALICAEIGPGDAPPEGTLALADRAHGKARLVAWRA